MTLYQKQTYGVNTKSTFLSEVSGNQIVEEQDKINVSPNQCVISTQIHSRTIMQMTELGPCLRPVNNDQGLILYDAWIYYEVGREEAMPTKEEPEKFDI